MCLSCCAVESLFKQITPKLYSWSLVYIYMGVYVCIHVHIHKNVCDLHVRSTGGLQVQNKPLVKVAFANMPSFLVNSLSYLC